MPWRRIIPLALLLLLAGAALNLAVALACAMFADPAKPVRQQGAAPWTAPTPAGWPERSRSQEVSTGFGWRWAKESAWTRWQVTTLTAGWPAPALRASWDYKRRTAPVDLQPVTGWRVAGVPAPAWLGESAFEACGGRIPMNPMWRGMVLNTLFYAVVIAAACAAGAIGPLRRWHRRATGRCPRCAYDLTGLRAGRCPECGSAVDGSKREAHVQTEPVQTEPGPR